MAERLSGVEALIWAADADPRLRSDFVSLSLLDRGPNRDRLRVRLASACDQIPRLRQKVVDDRRPGVGATWVDDPDFDLAGHLVEVRAAAPGGLRELLDAAAEVTAQPLDRTKPLWRMVLVRGLARRRCGLVQQFHHALSDGLGTVQIVLALVDAERDPPAPPEPPAGRAAGGGSARRTFPPPAEPAHRRHHLPRLPRPPGLASLASLPAPRTAVRLARSVADQVVVRDRARSPLWTVRSGERRFDAVTRPQAPARAAARALGGTLNDLFVTAVVGGLHRYHEAHDAPVAELRMAMPMSLRPGGAGPGDAASNRFTNARLLVPLPAPDPVARFGLVRERLAAVRSEPALALTEELAQMAVSTPGPLVRRALRRQSTTVDFAASNVPGSPSFAYLAGAKVEATWPLGPLTGAALNVTVLSYGGRLHLGFVSDPEAIPDPDLLVTSVEEAWDELLAAAP
jgi:WS/DGAT/MGAT family acyltransferase